MKTNWIRWTLALALALGAYGAAALDTAGASCAGTACRAVDGQTGGGFCVGHYCVAGSGGTGGGHCIGDFCQAGNGGTAGGPCIGASCKAGAGGTGGGSCNGKECQAGNGGTGGGSCAGPDCKPGNRARATPTTGPKNMPCCMAWYQLGLFNSLNFIQACDQLQARNKSPNKCEYRDRRFEMQTAEPIVAVAPEKMPDPPTSLESIKAQTRRAPDPRCPFNCQAWNPITKSCVGAPMNACDR